MNPERPFRIVTGVVREALRSSARPGVVLAGAGPEAELLQAWFQRAGVPTLLPPPELMEVARELLRRGEALRPLPEDPGQSTAHGAWEGESEWAVSGLAGRALALGTGRLLVGSESKTLLLLGCHPTQAATLPLGDLFSSEIQELTGACTLPMATPTPGHEEALAVDRALQSYLEEDTPREAALAGLPSPVREAVALGLDRARRAWRPAPLIPKLGGATLGIDLDL